MKIFIYIAVMALVTYLIRVIPFAAVRGKIRSQYLRSVLFYVPYSVLAAMTVPAIFYCTDDPLACAVGFAVAVLLAFLRKSLITVALAAVAGVLSTEGILALLGMFS
ncbi:MAG: AzlD domain-containing protein [Clostridia bacterium]|nr:AzlD domain-containing protein [Clostridia bacterium]